MKYKFDLKSLALGALLGAVIMFSIAATAGKSAWEYQIISGRLVGSGRTNEAPPLPKQLDQAAAEGWEVVSTASDEGFPFVIMRRAK